MIDWPLRRAVICPTTATPISRLVLDVTATHGTSSFWDRSPSGSTTRTGRSRAAISRPVRNPLYNDSNYRHGLLCREAVRRIDLGHAVTPQRGDAAAATRASRRQAAIPTAARAATSAPAPRGGAAGARS